MYSIQFANTQLKCFQNAVAESIPPLQQTRIFNSVTEVFTLHTNNRYICRNMSYYSNTFASWPSALLLLALHVLPCCIKESHPLLPKPTCELAVEGKEELCFVWSMSSLVVLFLLLSAFLWLLKTQLITLLIHINKSSKLQSIKASRKLRTFIVQLFPAVSAVQDADTQPLTSSQCSELGS